MENEKKGKRQGKKLKWILIPVGCIVLLCVFGVAILGINAIKKNLTSMNGSKEIVKVEKRDLSESISLSGSVSGAGQANVTSCASAEIKKMNVNVGDRVKAGDVICTLDSADIEKQIAQMEKSMDNADQLKKLQDEQNAEALSDAKTDRSKQVNKAKSEISKSEKAYKDGKSEISDMQNKLKSINKKIEKADKKLAEGSYDETSAEYKKICEERNLLAGQKEELSAALTSKKAEVSALKEGISSAKEAYDQTVSAANAAVKAAENTVKTAALTDSDQSGEDTLETLRKQLDDCEVLADMSGVITAVNYKEGDTYAQGTAIVTIENTDNLVVSASVDENDILKLQEGMDAIVTSNAIPDREIKGKVTRVVRVSGGSSTGDMTMGQGTGSSSYSVEVTIKDPDLLIGMTAKAKILISDKRDMLAVPYDLIREDEKGQKYIYKAVPENDQYKAVKCVIQTGDETDYYVEVTGGDIKEGEYIVYSPDVEEGEVFDGKEYHPDNNDAGADTEDGKEK